MNNGTFQYNKAALEDLARSFAVERGRLLGIVESVNSLMANIPENYWAGLAREKIVEDFKKAGETHKEYVDSLKNLEDFIVRVVIPTLEAADKKIADNI